MIRTHFSVPLPDGRRLDLGHRTLIMAILNVTPDSFADGGLRMDPAAAVADAERMVEQGADLIDIGGESTRPGAAAIPAEEEWRRVEPVLSALRRHVSVPLSIDTYKAAIARRAIDLGADIVNDISALTFDPEMAGVVAASHAAVVLMHTRGRPADMYANAVYHDVPAEVARELAARLEAAEHAGIDASRVILDPGIGFAKHAEHSFAAIRGLPALAALGRPILVGPSKKSYLKAALGDVPAEARDWGTAAAVTASVLFGAHIVRVHDVSQTIQVVRVVDAIVENSKEGQKGRRAGGQ